MLVVTINVASTQMDISAAKVFSSARQDTNQQLTANHVQASDRVKL